MSSTYSSPSDPRTGMPFAQPAPGSTPFAAQYPAPPGSGPGSTSAPWSGTPPLHAAIQSEVAGWPGASGPSVYSGPTTGQRPRALWPLTIIGAVFALLPGGIGLYFSAQVNERWRRGDAEGAQRASRAAMILGIAGIACGLLAWLVLIILIAVGASSPDPDSCQYTQC